MIAKCQIRLISLIYKVQKRRKRLCSALQIELSAIKSVEAQNYQFISDLAYINSLLPSSSSVYIYIVNKSIFSRIHFLCQLVRVNSERTQLTYLPTTYSFKE